MASLRLFHLGNLVVGSRSHSERNVFLSMDAHHLSIFLLPWFTFTHSLFYLLCLSHGTHGTHLHLYNTWNTWNRHAYKMTVLIRFWSFSSYLWSWILSAVAARQKLCLVPADRFDPAATCPRHIIIIKVAHFAPKTASQSRLHQKYEMLPQLESQVDLIFLQLILMHSHDIDPS